MKTLAVASLFALLAAPSAFADFGRPGPGHGGQGPGHGGPGYGGNLPGGSYLATCRNCDVNRDTLACYCDDGRGRMNYSTIFLPQCRTPIANTFGRLTCN